MKAWEATTQANGRWKMPWKSAENAVLDAVYHILNLSMFMDVLGAGVVTVLKSSKNSNKHASLLFIDPTPISYILIG